MKFKRVMMSLVCLALMASPQSFASTKSINVNFDAVKKIIVDSVDRTPAGKKAFVYEGTVYVPIQSLGDSLGKKMKWDGKQGTLFIGNYPNQIGYLTDIKPYNIADFTTSGIRYKIDRSMTIANETFAKGLQLEADSYSDKKVFYNFNGNYSRISGRVGLDDSQNSFRNEKPVFLNFYADDKLIQSIQFDNGDMSKPLDLDVTGCLKFVIEVSSSSNNEPLIDIVNPKIQ